MTTPGGFTAGDVLAAADMNLLPGGLKGIATVTADQTGISGVTDLTGLTVTFTTAASRRLKITGNARMAQITTGSTPELYITDGSGTVQNRRAITLGAGDAGLFHVEADVTPSAGSVTYKLRATTGAGTLTLQAGSDYPAFIRIEDVGKA